MTASRLFAIALPLFLVSALVAANCTGDPNDWSADGIGSGGGGGGGGGSGTEELPPACDPDDLSPCPDDWFVCTTDGSGGKRCEGQQPAVPDSAGGWDCEVQGELLVCHGDHLPPGDGGWVCEDQAEAGVVCVRESYTPASAGDGGDWDCEYSGEYLVCDTDGDSTGSGGGDGDADDDGPGGDGTGGCPPGVEIPSEEVCGDDVDNDCDGWIDESCADGGRPGDDTPPDDGGPPDDDTPPGEDDTPPDDDGPDGPPGCVCIPGAQRYCDTPTYCNWGIQVCDADGMDWGPCIETSPPLICGLFSSWYSPAGQACCVASGFCCQDYHDMDLDGDNWESLGDCVDIVCV